MVIRFVNTADTEALLHIYRPFVVNSAASFETSAPSVDEFAARVTAYSQKCPWIVADAGGIIAGYAYANKHREREAYQWSVETSVYVHPAFYRQRVATLLYSTLFNLLKEQGFVNAHAGIVLPNAASINLHALFGFTEIGVYKNVGFKLGAWHDVMWMAKPINEITPNPPEPKNIESILHLLP
jgi:phosphinothricin acetyltransferase